MTDKKCPKCGGTGLRSRPELEQHPDDVGRMYLCECTQQAPISPYACDKCNDTGRIELVGDAHRSPGRTACDCKKGLKMTLGAAIPDPTESAASYDPDSLSFYVELSKCAKRVNPNGVHAIVRDQAIALETYDLGVSFEEQQKFDLPPQVTILGALPADVFSQLMMNNLAPSASPDSSTIKFWIDVFQEMGPDYFSALKKLVAKLEWTV